MQTHEFGRLKGELDGPRLSRLRSTLGIAVASAALGAFEDAPSRAARPRTDDNEGPDALASPAGSASRAR